MLLKGFVHMLTHAIAIAIQLRHVRRDATRRHVQRPRRTSTYVLFFSLPTVHTALPLHSTILHCTALNSTQCTRSSVFHIFYSIRLDLRLFLYVASRRIAHRACHAIATATATATANANAKSDSQYHLQSTYFTTRIGCVYNTV